jgi:hypothetical protein
MQDEELNTTQFNLNSEEINEINTGLSENS